MSADIDVVFLTGRLVKDVEIKPVGQSFAVSGSIACNRTVKKDNEYKDIASFFDFKCWCKSEKQVEFYKSAFTKGAKICVNGTLIQETWEYEGNKHSRIVVDVFKIEPMGYFKGGASSEAGVQKLDSQSNVPAYDSESGFTEDIPF